MTFFSSIVQSIEDIFQGPRDVVTAAESTVHFYEAIWAELTDGRMWRSLGWLLLGLVLIVLGTAAWLRQQANPASIARQVMA